MIEAIRIQNLRSLKDTGFIDIKPLTILVGVNSSGKSSFLRSFPLFTQSLKKNLRGVISWFDDSFVDFGNYSTAKSKFVGSSETIKFSYKINLSTSHLMRRRSYYDTNDLGIDGLNNIEVELSFNNSSFDNETYVDSINLKVNGKFAFYIFIDDNSNVKFKLNDSLVTLHNQYKFTHHNNGLHILPSVISAKIDDAETNNLDSDVRFSIGTSLYASLYDYEIAYLFREFQPKFKYTKSNYHRISNLLSKWSFDKNEFLKNLKEVKINSTIDKIIANWEIGDDAFERLYSIILIQKLLFIFDIIDDEIAYFYLSSSYIAPIRARGDRFLRTQGLQIADIGSSGENLADFLESLSPAQKRSYNSFINKILDIKVEVKSYPNGYSLFLTQANEMFNILDVGFGYSQILPIITKLWWWYDNFGGMSNLYRMSVIFPTILIEQPELHLHPALQAKIADAFINTVRKKESNSSESDRRQKERMNLIIETHSQTIINRIGRRIFEGHLSPKDVNVVIFEKDYGKQISDIRQTSFDEKGKLANWPRGFFDPLDEPLY